MNQSLGRNGALLGSLLDHLAVVPAGKDLRVSGLALDSRMVVPGDVFLAVAGHRRHGLTHAADAVRRGAVAVLWDPRHSEALEPVPGAALSLPIENLQTHVGEIAARFHGHPSRAMRVIGVTGTDGKTSVSQCLAAALDTDTQPCGVIGTLGAGRWGEQAPTGMTTPDALRLQAMLASMRSAGMRQVVMEVSSHGLEQHRVSGVDFDVAIFTNLGHDHLDYHGTVDAYGEAKARLFRWPTLKTAIINFDDGFGLLLAKSLRGNPPVLGYGLAPNPGKGDYLRAVDVHFHPGGLAFDVDSPWGCGHINSRLLGRFNVLNLLAALGGLLHMDVTLSDALERLERVGTVPGRMELFPASCGASIVVDYAHTPQALAQALQAARAHCSGRLWCVFGCGGNRDASKRPLMAAVAQRHADRIVLTSDNPRHEDPLGIIAEVRAGFDRPDEVHVEVDRERAIRGVWESAGEGDIILLAGKGHETWQIFGDELRPFSDRELARELTGGAS